MINLFKKFTNPLVLLILWIIISILVFYFAGNPWGIFLILSAFSALVAAIRLKQTWLKLTFSCCLPLLVLCAGFEFYYQFNDSEWKTHTLYKKGQISKKSHKYDPITGYKCVGIGKQIKRYKGKELQQSTYTVAGRSRVTFPVMVKNPDTAVVFFGCSMTFGSYLNDDQNFPYLFGQYTKGKYKVFNFAMPGYGPHQMLAIIQHDLPKQLKKFKKIHFYFVGVPSHELRSAGLVQWDTYGPRYIIENGKLVHTGTFFDAKKLLGNCRIQRIFERSFLYSRISEGWFDKVKAPKAPLKVMVEIVKKANEELRRNYPNSTFTVITWKNWKPFTEPLLKDGISVLSFSKVLPDYDTNKALRVPHDTHASYLATQKIAKYLASLYDFPANLLNSDSPYELIKKSDLKKILPKKGLRVYLPLKGTSKRIKLKASFFLAPEEGNSSLLFYIKCDGKNARVKGLSKGSLGWYYKYINKNAAPDFLTEVSLPKATKNVEIVFLPWKRVNPIYYITPPNIQEM